MEISLIKFPVFRTRSANTHLHFVLYQIRQVIIRTIASIGFLVAISSLKSPINPTIDKKEIHLMPLAMGNFGKLKTPGRFFIIIFAQDK